MFFGGHIWQAFQASALLRKGTLIQVIYHGHSFVCITALDGQLLENLLGRRISSETKCLCNPSVCVYLEVTGSCSVIYYLKYRLRFLSI